MTRFHASRIACMGALAVAAGLPAAAAVAGPAAAATATAYKVTDMGSLGLGESSGYGVNATGQATGLSDLPSTYTYSCGYPVRTCTAHPYHAFLYSSGKMTDLGSVGSIDGVEDIESMSMSSNGQIAGWAASGTAFVYSNGTITHPSNFWPNAINDNGVTVGASSIDSGGKVQDLNSLIPAGSGDHISNATAINDNGQIIANGFDTANTEAALLLTPA